MFVGGGVGGGGIDADRGRGNLATRPRPVNKHNLLFCFFLLLLRETITKMKQRHLFKFATGNLIWAGVNMGQWGRGGALIHSIYVHIPFQTILQAT